MDRGVDCRRGSVVGNLEINDRILQPGPDSNLVTVPNTWRLRMRWLTSRGIFPRILSNRLWFHIWDTRPLRL